MNAAKPFHPRCGTFLKNGRKKNVGKPISCRSGFPAYISTLEADLRTQLRGRVTRSVSFSSNPHNFKPC